MCTFIHTKVFLILLLLFAAGGEDQGYNAGGGEDRPQDPWVQTLKILYANMPEGFTIWLANVKQSLVPVLEWALQLLEGLA